MVGSFPTFLGAARVPLVLDLKIINN